MSIVRHYVMQAKPGGGDRLAAVLGEIVALVRPVPGCEDAEALRDQTDPERFVLIERWDSVESHRAAGPHLQRDLLPQLIAALNGQPDAAYCDLVATA